MAWVDGQCNFRDAELLKHMASGDFDSDYSILARQYRMALWAMYRFLSNNAHIPNIDAISGALSILSLNILILISQ